MRRIQTRGLVAAMEEERVEEVIPAVVAPVEGEVVDPAVAEVARMDNAESLETELLEVQETVEVGDEQAGQVEEAQEVIEAMDEYQEALETIASQGGLDRNGALILQIGMEQLCARAGIEPARIAMPSLESYGGTSSRIGTTKLAMEGIKETAKVIWENIIKAIKRAGEWLKGFWKQLSDSNVRLKTRAEKIAAAAKATKGEAKSAELENAGLANKLQYNGKVEKNFGQDFGGFAKFCEAMAGKVVPAVVGYSKEVVDSISKSVNDPEQDNIQFKAASVKSAFSSLNLTESKETSAEGVDGLKSEQLLGGKALFVQVPTADGVEGAIAFSKCKNGISLVKADSDKASSPKLPVLAAGEIAGVAGDIISVSKSVDEMHALEKEFDSFIKSMLAGAAGFSKSVDLANDAVNAKIVALKKKMQVARSLFTSMITRVSNLPANFGSYALSTSKAAMDYCELSLKQY